MTNIAQIDSALSAMSRKRAALETEFRASAHAALSDPKKKARVAEVLDELEALEREAHTAEAARSVAAELDRETAIEAAFAAFTETIAPASAAVKAAGAAGDRLHAAIVELIAAHAAVEETSVAHQFSTERVINAAGFPKDRRSALLQALRNYKIVHVPPTITALVGEGMLGDDLKWFAGMERRAATAAALIDGIEFQEPNPMRTTSTPRE